jgi:hypothetical protein
MPDIKKKKEEGKKDAKKSIDSIDKYYLIVKYLLSNGADQAITNALSQNALALAYERNNSKVIELFK